MALGSVCRLVRYASSEEKTFVQKKICKYKKELQQLFDGMEKNEFILPSELPEEYIYRIPQKTVRGGFSTEKYMQDTSVIPVKLLPEIHRWSAAPWLENFFYLADGRKTLGELYKLLPISGFRVEKDLFTEMILYLKKDGMLRFI